MSGQAVTSVKNREHRVDRHGARWLVVAAIAAQAMVSQRGAATAQASRDPAAEVLLEGDTTTLDDPLSTGGMHTLRDVPDPNAPMPIDFSRPPSSPTVEAMAGPVLTAIAGVREVDHRIDARFRRDGLMEVALEMRFINRSRHAAELLYRLPVPRGARPALLEVCLAGQCRAGRFVSTTARPPAHGAAPAADGYDDAVQARGPIEPRDGSASSAVIPIAQLRVDPLGSMTPTIFRLRAAPLQPGRTLTLRVRYLAEVTTHGGIAHVRIPERERDPRTAPAEVSLRADTLLQPAIDGEPSREAHATRDPWSPLDLTATQRSGGEPDTAIHTFRCGTQQCARLHAHAGPRAARAERTFLLLDISPSMVGPARGRVSPALATLMGTLHPRSMVRAVAFAATSRALVENWVSPLDLPLAAMARAYRLNLGGATRFESAWHTLDARPEDHLILVGDGGLTLSESGKTAMQEARARGVRVSVINLEDRPIRPELAALVEQTGGVVAQVARESEEAARGRSSARLEEKLAALTAPIVASVVEIRSSAESIRLGPLRAGESITWLGVVSPSTRFVVGTPQPPQRWTGALAVAMAHAAERSATIMSATDPEPGRSCSDSRPAQRSDGVSTDAAPVALALARTCAEVTPEVRTASEGLGRGVPAETVLSMLRQRLVPAARRCFRRDRGGRGDYSVRAVFELELADREIAAAAVRGEISERLRGCLESSLEGLDVPRFRGSVLVRYPLHTERHPPPPTIELRDDVARAVDRALSD